MSTIQSAHLITSMLCSITTTVLPRSTRRCKTPNSLSISSKCNPVVGSSSKYKRVASHGTRKFGGQLDSLCFTPRKRRRGLTERDVIKSHVAKRLSEFERSWNSLANNSTASPHGISKTSAIDFPCNLTSSTSSLYRREPHSLHGTQTSAKKVHLDSSAGQLPSHVSQRPPGTLKLNVRAVNLRSAPLRECRRTVGGSNQTRRCMSPDCCWAYCPAAIDRHE